MTGKLEALNEAIAAGAGGASHEEVLNLLGSLGWALTPTSATVAGTRGGMWCRYCKDSTDHFSADHLLPEQCTCDSFATLAENHRATCPIGRAWILGHAR